jgi:hypothetical protein
VKEGETGRERSMSSGMFRRADLVRSDVSEVRTARNNVSSN